jgi:nucleoside-diphosphate-sugar epimerase
MNILVIGGTGFIGSYVVRHLAQQGHRVTVFHRGSTLSDLSPDVDQILGSHDDLPSFSNKFREHRFDVAIDMILSDETQARTLISALRGIVPRVVAVSSQDVYRAYGILHRRESGPLEPLPLTEDSPLREELHMLDKNEAKRVQQMISWVTEDDEKIMVERVVMNDPDLSGSVVRLPAVYGPGDPQHRLHQPLKRMDDGRPRHTD